MKSNIKVGGVASVAISSLESYPSNPRRGDIDAIATSLKAHGQYRPIVVQYGTNYILAGRKSKSPMSIAMSQQPERWF